ncbi:hypothetical protein NB640_11085 [Oxalobacter vibrioformis]|uniref:Uncharacterized protein n=1 Tax=Oxalobacter vibrioformis TaxID=933080 RepID=A0A9E9LV69_9BURK|nr:hypothetical protein [Oxalobacter vibrioformis]WAW09756.1 hypothetical protein NB640_11085 [Oxalobacter vibrioformis]
MENGKKQEVEVFDEEGNLLDPAPLPKIDLHDAHAIRRELGSVYRDMRSGRIETQEGTRLAYVLDMIRKAYDTSVLQERVEFLERAIERRKKK